MSQILAGSKSNSSAVNVDDIFVAHLLKSYMECPSDLTLFYSTIKMTHKQLHMAILAYFRPLLIKLYHYNKNQTPEQQRFYQSLSSLFSVFNRDSDSQMMNRALQLLLGLWINYQNNSSSKADIMKQK